MDSYEVKNGNNVGKLAAEKDQKNFDNQQLILSNLLHAADISNPAKPEAVYDQWIKVLFEEFFKQGDIEKNQKLTVSLLCDRAVTNIEKAQIGFINYIVAPLWDLVYQITPESAPYVDNIKMNLKRFEEIVKKKEAEKK